MDFPLPLGPAGPTVWPGSTRNETPVITGGVGR
ncbi:hypothetical protein JOF56_007784 [Kibdelosporangium banguiense]|uniref:Uncharacterized protein n=1 Tax=Kibdelosporangium banguiense TaxID=1365924 RepID=A0ABS4TTU1_9PSEU|nr:hypothetical protein [Kibdelosporangium banguiense]